jgi:hypothetical protein
VKRGQWLLGVTALVLFCGGFVAGSFYTANRCNNCNAAPLPTQVVYAVDEFALPAIDAPGADIEGLPRYPGSRRVEYRQSIEEGLLVAEVEYVAAADLETVHDFYREVFYADHWIVADLGFYQGEWTFFVLNGDREALVEVEARGPLVEIEIELSEPQRPETREQ